MKDTMKRLAILSLALLSESAAWAQSGRDGTFRSSFEETTGPVTNRISLTLRPVQN
jgi:hypothetical protein